MPTDRSSSSRPLREAPRSLLVTRATAVLALAATVAYLAWRASTTMAWSVWWIAVPLLALEVHAAVSLALFVHDTWDVTSIPAAVPAARPDGKLAVLIPTYNEPVEVLLPTVAAAVALRPAHETWVLDDGDRDEVERLARSLGARYLRRSSHEHAKAGNLNHALGVVDAEFVAVLDADHVALPGFLVRTLGYFADPRVAVVQTPQDFYNVESFEHEGRRVRHLPRFSEQGLFYRVLQPGKNRWGAGFWCGTNAVVRTAALESVGGVASETVTEDIHTTIRFHRAGWRSVYHNEVLARGLAAADAEQYGAQRLRWGTGAMQVLRVENPMLVPGLTLHQRLSYAETLLGWFDSWRSLGYLLVPPIVLATGAVPIRASRNTFIAAFVATYLIQRLALERLSRGRAPLLLSTVFELVRMESNFRATLTLFTRRPTTFRVTPKGRVGEQRQRPKVPVVLEGVLILTAAVAGWFVASAAGLTPLHYRVAWAAYGAAFWLVFNAAFVAMAALRVRDARFAGERRASVRFDVDLPGHLDESPVAITDMSLTGAHLVIPKDELVHARQRCALRVSISGQPIELAVIVRSRRLNSQGGEDVGVEFEPGQDEVRASLALALFHSPSLPVLERPGTGGGEYTEMDQLSAAGSAA